ncbi:WG repeat-containing protein [Paenibacillus illinoisensis]|uniref:KWG Leptospira repeat protein n=1 Tax=Paenibacillus illinoisensis TaxID=59845 RepID=A0A2W0C0E0_9BACL|nr:WG repeat-containing protein [Paenibacillus illinoisensis]PYY25673.1 KWG Leptospira repeat protein [Paenibacillus illinoisensis]
MDHSGSMIIKDNFQGVGDFQNNLAPVENRGMHGYINKNGKYIIKNVFTTADSFYMDLAVLHLMENGANWMK